MTSGLARSFHEGIAMRFRQLPLIVATTLYSLPALAYVGACTSAEGSVSVSITTDDRGQITDLTLKQAGVASTRYPEANARMVVPSSFVVTFSAKANASHEALELNIAGKVGRMRFGGQSTALECDWD
jgi:hypothetical protein